VSSLIEEIKAAHAKRVEANEHLQGLSEADPGFTVANEYRWSCECEYNALIKQILETPDEAAWLALGPEYRTIRIRVAN
jgi:hypothetical protein